MENRMQPDEFERHAIPLIVTLWKSCYPHEKLCFLMIKCLEKPDGIDWTPKAVVEAFSEWTLRDFAVKILEDYASISNIPQEVIEACFLKILFQDMERRVKDVIKRNDHGARWRWKAILKTKVSDTRLSDYFENNPPANISNWMHQVHKRLKKFLKEGKWLERPLEDLLDELIRRQ